MTNPEISNSDSPTVTQDPSAPVTPAVQPPNTAKKSWLIIILVFGAGIIGLCACVGLCVAVLGTTVVTGITERDNVEQVLDAFMSAMEDKDVQTAYSYFSVKSQTQTDISDLEQMLEGNNYFLFKDYKSLSIQGMNFSSGINTNPNAPQGTVVTISAIVSYTNGFEGAINAVLEQNNGEWRIYNIGVVVPPDKFEP
jgi:hypothetical protein